MDKPQAEPAARQKWQEIQQHLEQGSRLPNSHVHAMGFASEADMLEKMRATAQNALEPILASFKAVHLNEGYQTESLHDSRYAFVVKQLLKEGDRPIPESIKDFKVAQRLGGGLVTPFIFLTPQDRIVGIASRKIDVLQEHHIERQGKTLVDSVLNLYDQNMLHGFFDPDLILSNYGFQDGKLVNLDFGWSKDLWRDETYIPGQDLHWDPFHLGIGKFREMAGTLKQISPGLDTYFLNQISERYGISFNRKTERCPRSSAEIVPLANQLRQVVRQKRGTSGFPVYPLIGKPVTDVVYNWLYSRIDKTRL